MYFFSLFVGAGVWTQGFTLAKEAIYHLSHISSPFCFGYFFGNGGLAKYLSRLASNCNPSDLSLLRKHDYRHEHRHLANKRGFKGAQASCYWYLWGGKSPMQSHLPLFWEI
jgi:hypothetical protein